MKKGVPVKQSGLVPILESSFFLCVAVILGGITGCILVVNADADSSAQLTSFLAEYIACAAGSNLNVPCFDLLLQWGGRLGLAFLIEWSVFRMFGLSLFLFLQGCIVSFAVSCFIAVFGVSGLIVAFVLFGVPTLFFFSGLFCVHWKLSDHVKLQHGKETYGVEIWTVIGICLLCLAAIVLSEYVLGVKLLPAAAKFAVSFHVV